MLRIEKGRIMAIDVHNYLHHFDGYEMTEEQKIDYLRSIEHILQSFVEMAWSGTLPQLALGTTLENDPETSSDAVESDQSPKPTFNEAAR